LLTWGFELWLNGEIFAGMMNKGQYLAFIKVMGVRHKMALAFDLDLDLDLPPGVRVVVASPDF
jgi:hypothetical protein